MKIDLRLVITSAAIGILIIFPWLAYFLETKLLESVATLWGSALGAIAAVAGAFWVADRQAAQQKRSSATLVREMFHPVAFALDELAFIYGPPSRPQKGNSDDEPDIFNLEKWQDIADYAGFVTQNYKKFIERIHRYEAGLNLLSAEGLQAALALETEIEDIIRDVITPLSVRLPDRDATYYPEEFEAKAASWGTRFALSVSNRHVHDHMAVLRKEAS